MIEEEERMDNGFNLIVMRVKVAWSYRWLQFRRCLD